jgi:hypothetical protein
MNKEKADNMLIEIHGDVKMIRRTQKDHGQTLYGIDGKGGTVEDVTLLKERQDQCPARRAASQGGRQFKLAKLVMLIAVLEVIAAIVIGIMF